MIHAQPGEGVKSSNRNRVPLPCVHFSEKMVKKSCLFFQVNVHVLCTQDDIPSVEMCGVRKHQFMLNNLKIEAHTVVLDIPGNAFT